MPKTKTTSPARSQGGATTPKRKTTRGSRSLCSPALSTASGRLTSLIDQFKDKNMESFALSPFHGRSVLNDNTEIGEPRRKSWWKKLDENSQDVMEVLEDNRLTVNNPIEEFIDIEVLSQEKKNFTLDLPESSDNESINSIVLPQRRLFTQKENQPQKKYGHLIDNRESLAKLHKTNTANIDKTVNVGTRELFQNAKRSKPFFPSALLNISPNKTAADKTRENVIADPKPQVRNIFGNRPANKRKNMFADFIVSESEDEIPEIQPKVFGFQKKLEQRRISSISKGRDASPASSITTDIEMDFGMLLPSSTMVENQLEDNMLVDNTPIKRAKLSKLSEAKESEAGTLQTNTTSDKTKQSDKSVASKNKSKASPGNKDKSLNSSRTTRSMLKNASKRGENVNTSVKQDAKSNKSRSKLSSKGTELDVSPSKSETDKQNTTLNTSQKQNKSRTRNSSQAIETEIESEEIVVNAINNVTRVINKSKNNSLPNTTATNKSVNEKEATVALKVHDKVNKSGSNDVEQNDQEEDENNFTLEFENDDEVVEEAVVNNDLNENQKDSTKKHNTVALEKDNQETEINKSKSNKSLEQKPAKIVEESVESQTELYSADDNVDGNQEQETETVQNIDEEIVNQEIGEDVNNSREDINEEMEHKDEVSVSQEKEEAANESEENEEEANESEEKEDEVIVNQESEDEQDESQEKVGDEYQEVENVENESEEEEEEDNENEEDDKISNESKEGEEEASESQEVEAEVNESQEIEEQANESQEVEAEVNESQKIEEETNESQEIEKEANESPEIEAEGNESQEDEEEANESQEAEEEASESQAIDEEAHESKEVVDADASDEENDEEINEEEEEAANESQVNETSANESHEVENDEERSHEVASGAESEEVEDDQQMDSDEADNAIASDPEMSDDNRADEMEVDAAESEQESDNEIEQESDNESEHNEHESHEEIEESPNVTHDTTGRHRKKHINKSPEVVLHDKTNQIDSFSAKGKNTSVRKTKSMIKNLNISTSLAPSRDNADFSDGTRDSSAEGSGWDSHRTTRKTLRQTFGKDFTPRKSLRALVMEKSAKRQTEHLEMHSETAKLPLANSTELLEHSNHVEDIVDSDHEVSRRTRQTTLEMYLQKMKEQNIEKKLKMEQAVRNSLKNPVTNSLSLFKVPTKPAPRRPKHTQSKAKKQLKSIIPFDELPSEVIEDMKYKPPKRFQPTNASWITKRLYKYLENKLEGKYDYKARVRAEKLVETIYFFAKDLRRHDVAPPDAVDVLKHELARLEVVRTHFEFYEFFHEFMPREVRVKVVPDIVNKIALPRHGVFSDILRGNTVHG